jgi:GT2 family glycosyltransferase
MSIRKSLIKLAKSIESGWQLLDCNVSPVNVSAGWYVTEFILKGALANTPRIIIEGAGGKPIERLLTGFHSGRNRMLLFLPAGRMTAISESVEFTLLAKVPWWEGRARILLICFRYLIDFFSPWVLIKMIAMQFNKPLDLSNKLSAFYAPPAEAVAYLNDVLWWQKWRRHGPVLGWFYRDIKIAVLIEDESQREALTDMMVPADAILMADQSLPTEIDYLIPLAKSEQLRAPAILMLKRALRKTIKANRRADKSGSTKPKLVYADHDYQFDQSIGQKVMEPVFKPNPSAAYLHCYDYLGPSILFSAAVLDDCCLSDLHNSETQYRLAIDIFQDVSDVLHVADVLFISSSQQQLATPQPNDSKSHWPDITWQRHGDYNVLRADLDWQDQPSVDLVIPTRDGLAVLKPCVESILELTEYSNYKIIIVDNGSELAETHEFLSKASKDPRVKVVDFPGEFNYSAINNFAIAQGSSDYVAMVNNDIEVIHGDWLNQMMVWAKQANVGIVGAKLLFGSGLIQHAGVTIGMGNAAGHIHRLEDGDALGYQNRCMATQNMMAVTAACLITPRSLFEDLGGLDAEHFKVAYNDIDYCLRVEKTGLDIIWTPEARLYHHESVSRGDDMSSEHIERYFYELGILKKRWKTVGYVDKYYSRHLRISDEGVYPQVSVKGSDKLRIL